MRGICCGSLALLLSLSINACNGQTSNSIHGRVGQVTAADGDGQCSEPDIKGSSTRPQEVTWMTEAWKRFVADGRYCIPSAQLFRIPVAAMTDPHRKVSLEGTVRHPYGWGDFNKDLLSQDFVAFVIDKTKEPPHRFGMVIFNEPGEKSEVPHLHWVFKDRDLSRSTLDGGSGIFIISTYNEDGTSEGCYVNWNGMEKSYSCDEKYQPVKH